MCAGLANWRSRQHVSSDDATRALQLLTVAMDVTAVKTCKTDGSRRGSAAQRGQQGDATGGPDEHSVVVPLPRQVVAHRFLLTMVLSSTGRPRMKAMSTLCIAREEG